jgi:NAD(P)-dependent dehydrogenase (short-subunit alcohol dehydrogenase family)
VDRVKDSIPLGRGGQPEEVARAILWLASAEASFVTGAFLDVTGGK